ncbi:MAG: hypothetical protein ACC657_05210 [Thiohalomonadales bacterium]
MQHNKLFSDNVDNSDKDLYAVIDFLNEKFGAKRYLCDYPENVVTLAGRRWWVVTSAAEKEFDLCIGGKCDKSSVIKTLNKLDAGLLVFRKTEKKFLYTVYLIDKIEILAKLSNKHLTIKWADLYLQDLIYERGLVMDNEIIGFRKLRRCRLDLI